jgi:hypothetical protein
MRKATRARRKRARNGRKLRLEPLMKACGYGHFGRTFAYELIKQGKIAAHKRGNRTMVDLNSIDRYLRSLPRVELR